MKIIAAMLLFCALSGPSLADEQQDVGNFIINREPDKFSGAAKVIALTGSGDTVLALRCLSSEISVTLVRVENKETAAGDIFKIKYKIDQRPIVEAYGKAVSKLMIQFASPDDQTLFDGLAGAKEVSFRITNRSGLSSDVTFPLVLVDEAIARVRDACKKAG